MMAKSDCRFLDKIMLKQKTGTRCRLEEKSSHSVEPPSFDAHLRARNAERLHFASFGFAAVMLALIASELIVPVLWSTELIFVQGVSALYFCALASLCRTGRTARWPTPALPLLFGTGTIATGLLISLNLEPRFGANPAYATTVFVACLAPLWTRRALLSMLIPVHGLYLWSVFTGPYDAVFRTVMTMGGTVALPLGAVTAMLAFRHAQRAFEDMAAIRNLLDERRDMVAMVAHDLQSPLAGIRALLRTISGRSQAETAKLAEIERACRDMYGAVTRLVEAHRHDGAERPGLAVVRVDTLFRDAKTKASTVAAEKDITIIAESPELSVSAEPSLLSAILDNLLSNAIKFSPIGSVVRLVAEPRETDVRLCVFDNGPGIAAEEVPLLFKKFTRLRTLPTAGEQTTGLGLYIVRVLAERMGARTSFAPNPHGGSIFCVDVLRPR
jgi:signal transduction histidine kinase